MENIWDKKTILDKWRLVSVFQVDNFCITIITVVVVCQHFIVCLLFKNWLGVQITRRKSLQWSQESNVHCQAKGIKIWEMGGLQKQEDLRYWCWLWSLCHSEAAVWGWAWLSAWHGCVRSQVSWFLNIFLTTFMIHRIFLSAECDLLGNFPWISNTPVLATIRQLRPLTRARRWCRAECRPWSSLIPSASRRGRRWCGKLDQQSGGVGFESWIKWI